MQQTNLDRFYEWCVKVGIDLSSNEQVTNAYQKIE